MHFQRSATFAATLALAGCATAPELIQPSYVSPVTYESWTCQQLSEEGHRLLSAYSVAAQRQHQAQTGDAVGVVLVGLPIASMTGQNIAPEIARLKGEHHAIYQAAIRKNCPRSGVPAETASVR